MILRALGPACALLLAACGSAKVQKIDATWAVGAPGRLEIRGPRVAISEPWPESAEKDAAAMLQELREELADRLAGPDPVLVLDVGLVEYRPEYSEPKIWGGGGGFVKGTVTLEVVFLDAMGTRVGAIRSTGVSISRGWSVGSMASACRRALGAVVAFVEDSIPRGPAGGAGNPEARR